MIPSHNVEMYYRIWCVVKIDSHGGDGTYIHTYMAYEERRGVGTMGFANTTDGREGEGEARERTDR